MADSLVLKGVKDVRKHTGSEMMLVRPKRGGDTHQLKKWWLTNINSTVYVGCSLFRVTAGGGSVYLAVDSQEMSTIRIDHDGSFNFAFYGINGISRAALYDENMALIEHYVFPRISGGRIMTVTPAGGASRPGAGAGPTTIGTVTIVGDTTANDGEAKNYSLEISGDATDLEYAWSSSGNAISNIGADIEAATCEFVISAGTSTIQCEVSSATATDSPVTGTLAVNATRTVAQGAAAADHTFVVTENGGVYELDGVAQDTVNMAAGETVYFDLSDASLSGHPFAIYTDSSKTTTVSVGIETSEDGTILLFTPPISGNFSYQCTAHAAMGGRHCSLLINYLK
jgi:plastocyanin